jgi:hypothetical protein
MVRCRGIASIVMFARQRSVFYARSFIDAARVRRPRGERDEDAPPRANEAIGFLQTPGARIVDD